MTNWDYTTDFLVVGSGNGLVGAITATAAGKDVLVVEKTDIIGGSTGISGGVYWIPNNPLMQRENVPDSLDDALRYFDTLVGEVGPASSEARRKAYLESGIDMVRFLEEQGMEFIRCEGYSDLYADVRGFEGGNARGRSIEAVPTDTRRIGELANKIRPGIAGKLILRTGEAAPVSMVRVSPAAMVLSVKIALRTALGRIRRQKLTTNGAALLTQYLEILARNGTPIWTETAFRELIVDDGRVIGAVVERGGESVRVRARDGVLLAAGGFGRNPAMRAEHSGDQPNEGKWTLSNPGDTGEVMQAAIDLGAATDLMDEAWWLPGFRTPEGRFATAMGIRSAPGCIIVDSDGERYFNEATAFMEVGQQMYRRKREKGADTSSWMILDARNRSRYLLGKLAPRQTPKAWIDGGFIKRSDTIAGLAAQCGMDPATLEATVQRVNGFAKTGVDEDFHRGEGAHEKYQGDPTNKPNPCLGPLAKAPFYAVELFPCDLGTSGGLLCDEHARVLDTDDEPIAGLYAAGNITASVMGRSYPGAGASIAASAIFSYIAANHAAVREESALTTG